MGRRGQLDVRVDAVGPLGLGHATDDRGRAVRVAGVLPGERVVVGVHHVRRDGTQFGRLDQVREAADQRRRPSCVHHLVCGGCDFLHASYDWQLRWKRQRVASALERPLSAVAPTVASPKEWGYRNLLKLVRGPGGRLGSYAPRSHDVVDMTGCQVHAPGGERLADTARSLLRDHPQVAFRYLIIRWSTTESRAVVTIVVRTGQRPSIDELIEVLRRRDDVAQVRVHLNDDPGDGLLTANEDELIYDDGRPVVEQIGAARQNLTGGAFSQINPGAAERLYGQVTEAVRPRKKRILDLYSGSGGIALTLLGAGADAVYAIESSRNAVDAAVAAAADAGWSTRLKMVANAVERALDDAPPIETVVVNPPRKGLSAEVRTALAARPWQQMVYVSCDPDTLARDVAALPGRVESVVPVDLFPQTRHVETVLSLIRTA